MSGIRIVRAEGDPYRRGLTIGRALAPTIRESAAFNLGWFERRGLGRAELERLSAPLLAATERHLPDELAALGGMADGAGLELLDVLVPNAWEELHRLVPSRADDYVSGHSGQLERCSALTVALPGTTLLGHDEQWLAAEPGEIVLIVEVPDEPGGPAIVSPTAAAFRPQVGWATTGHAQGVMSLAARDDRLGVPRVLVSRVTLDASDRADALARSTPPERSGGYAYLHAFRGGDTCLVETSATGSALVGGPGVHANHYLDEDLAERGAAPSAGSLARHARLAALVAAEPLRTPEVLMRFLSDHDSTPSAICVHADTGEGDEAEAVSFAMVCDLEAGRMWVAPGRPCETRFEAFDLDELVAG